MLSDDYLELLNKWKTLENTFKRDIENKILPFVSSKNCVFLYGPRRSGKSIVAKRILTQMPKNTITRYVNLEDPKLMNLLNVDLMDTLSEGLKKKDTIVFDEVQLIKGWEKWVRRAVDTQQCQVIVTGSSAKLLSGEFATTLGGRGIGFQILPLSFAEFHRVSKKSFEEYLKLGGYPEVVLNPEKKDKLLESYFELTLIKDIVTRYNIRDTASLRNLALYLLTNSSKETSLKQIRNTLGLSYDTIRQFIEYLESSFLIFQVLHFSYSLKESLTKPRKIYAIDTGMQQYATKSFTPDSGQLAENAVAIELKNKGNEVFYWKGKREVDLIAKNKIEITPINITYTSTPSAREYEGLMEFTNNYKSNPPEIIYTGKTNTIQKEKLQIKQNNIQEWLLQK
jgi:predicted AAA+ superfamily ATPase